MRANTLSLALACALTLCICTYSCIRWWPTTANSLIQMASLGLMVSTCICISISIRVYTYLYYHNIHTHAPPHTHIRTHTHTHTPPPTHTHTYTHTRVRAREHTRANTKRTHKTHTQAHTSTQTRKRTHDCLQDDKTWRVTAEKVHKHMYIYRIPKHDEVTVEAVHEPQDSRRVESLWGSWCQRTGVCISLSHICIYSYACM